MKYIFGSFLLISLLFFNVIAYAYEDIYEDPQETLIILGSDTAYISGWIGPINEWYFKSLDFTKIKKVNLSSTGGIFSNATIIAEIVRDNNLETIVDENNICFSACAIIFQAGTKRTAHVTARFMYHYAYNRSGLTNNIIIINEPVSYIMFEQLLEYGISSILINRIKANKDIDIEIGVKEAISYRIVTHIIR